MLHFGQRIITFTGVKLHSNVTVSISLSYEAIVFIMNLCHELGVLQLMSNSYHFKFFV